MLGANPTASEKPKRNLASDFHLEVNKIKGQISRCKNTRQLDFIASKHFTELRIAYARLDRAIVKKAFLDLWSLWLNHRMILTHKK